MNGIHLPRDFSRTTVGFVSNRWSCIALHSVMAHAFVQNWLKQNVQEIRLV